jgi:hypothetical protein
MDKPQLTGQNLGRVFNSRCGRVVFAIQVTLITKTALLKVENWGQTTFRFSPFNIRAFQNGERTVFSITLDWVCNIKPMLIKIDRLALWLCGYFLVVPACP